MEMPHHEKKKKKTFKNSFLLTFKMCSEIGRMSPFIGVLATPIENLTQEELQSHLGCSSGFETILSPPPHILPFPMFKMSTSSPGQFGAPFWVDLFSSYISSCLDLSPSLTRKSSNDISKGFKKTKLLAPNHNLIYNQDLPVVFLHLSTHLFL